MQLWASSIIKKAENPKHIPKPEVQYWTKEKLKKIEKRVLSGDFNKETRKRKKGSVSTEGRKSYGGNAKKEHKHAEEVVNIASSSKAKKKPKRTAEVVNVESSVKAKQTPKKEAEVIVLKSSEKPPKRKLGKYNVL